MFSEFQTTTDRFIKMVRNTLRDKLDAAVIEPFTLSGQLVWVERRELVGEPNIGSEPGDNVSIALVGDNPNPGFAFNFVDVISQRILISQDIRIRLASRSGAVFTPVATGTIRVHLTLTSRLLPGAGVVLQFALGKFELLGSDDLALQSILATQLGQLIQTSSLLIPFGAFILPYIDAKETHLNEGIALSRDKSFISIRLETLSQATTGDPWKIFYAGGSENHLTSAGTHGFVPSSSPAPWCLFVEKEAFTVTTGLAVESALRGANVFDFPPGVGAEWSAPNGASIITISFLGQKTVLGILAYADVRITLDTSVPTTNRIRFDVGFTFSADIAGIDITGIIKLISDRLLSSLIGTTVSASEVLGDGSSPLGGLGKNIQCTVTSISSLRCEGSAIPPAAGSLAGNLRDSLGLSQGIVLMGDGKVQPALTDPDVQLAEDSFRWVAVPPDCANLKGFSDRARNRALFSALLATGAVTVSSSNLRARRLTINKVEVLDDPPPGLYRTQFNGFLNDYVIYASCGYPPASFFTNPYPCILAIYTNVGVTLAKLNPPPEQTEEQVRKLVSDAVGFAISRCVKLKAPWAVPFLNPEWLVDPAPKVERNSYVQIWEFEVPASSVGGTITTILGRGQLEVRTIAAAGRSLSASFLTGLGENLELRFQEAARRESSPQWHPAVADEARTEATAETDRLGVTQTLLCKAADLALGSTLKGIELVAAGSGPLLAAGLESGLILFDLNAPSAPLRIITISLDGLVGLTEGPRGQVLAWGDFGMIAIERRGNSFFTTQVLGSCVHSAARLGGRWFASTTDTIMVLDCDLQQERRLPRPRGCCGHLCSLPNKLLWTSDGAAFQLSPCGGTWNPVGSEIVTLPSSFETVRVGRTQYLFAAHVKTGGSLWTLAGGHLALITEYDEDPWFRQSARLPQLFVTANRAGVVSIYGVAGQSSE